MGARNVQSQLTTNQIFNLLNSLGAEPIINNSNQITSTTICHGGSTDKLIYYDNTKSFICFTGDCGNNFSIFDLVMKVNKIDFYSSYSFVCNYFGIDGKNYSPTISMNNTSFFNNFNKEKFEREEFEIIDKSILNHFYDFYHESWINDNINSNTMNLFDIKFSIEYNQIIIPHFDINENLIGIRVRNLNQKIVDSGRKYMPLYHNGNLYNHAIGANIYGLHLTKPLIEYNKKIILFEGEKSVYQLNSMLPQMNFSGGLSGSNLTNEQVEILKNLNIDEVIVALDKEYKEINTEEEEIYKRKIRKNFINKLLPYFKVSILWDTNNLVDYKKSPTDMGKEVFLELYNNRLRIVQ